MMKRNKVLKYFIQGCIHLYFPVILMPEFAKYQNIKMFSNHSAKVHCLIHPHQSRIVTLKISVQAYNFITNKITRS